MVMKEKQRLERVLLANLKKEQAALQKLLDDVNDAWCYEDGIYRFYHQSFKVFNLQEATQGMVDAFTKLAPDGRGFCELFWQIVAAGTGRRFQMQDNEKWAECTAPIVQAFLHARYFLEMAVKYAAELTEPPQTLPSGWAAMLELYEIR
jgi:hypothetical protein